MRASTSAPAEVPWRCEQSYQVPAKANTLPDRQLVLQDNADCLTCMSAPRDTSWNTKGAAYADAYTSVVRVGPQNLSAPERSYSVVAHGICAKSLAYSSPEYACIRANGSHASSHLILLTKRIRDTCHSHPQQVDVHFSEFKRCTQSHCNI